MRSTHFVSLSLAALYGLLVALAPAVAFAHERRVVAGKYEFVVGWSQEPAVVGQLNGVDLRVTNTQTGQPVAGLDQTLAVAVAYGGGEPRQFSLEPVFGQQGRYRANLIPTRAGDYVFRFSGTVEDVTINEMFESGPGRFEAVQEASTLEFPAASAGTSQALEEARSVATSASQLAVYALGTGIVGLVLGAAGLAVSLRRGKA